jgi:hypothetical protein
VEVVDLEEVSLDELAALGRWAKWEAMILSCPYLVKRGGLKWEGCLLLIIIIYADGERGACHPGCWNGKERAWYAGCTSLWVTDTQHASTPPTTCLSLPLDKRLGAKVHTCEPANVTSNSPRSKSNQCRWLSRVKGHLLFCYTRSQRMYGILVGTIRRLFIKLVMLKL